MNEKRATLFHFQSPGLLPFLSALIWLVFTQFSFAQTDWLIENSSFKSKFESETPTQDAQSQKFFRLTNGLVTRRFLLHNKVGASVGLTVDSNQQSILRAVKPEATVTIGGRQYSVGGLSGQPNHAYLLDKWLNEMKPAKNALQLVGYKTSVPDERIKWKRVRHHAPDVKWPPPGIKLTLEFVPTKSDKPAPDFRVFVHYELYDGIPVFCKWITVENRSAKAITIDRFASEMLAVVEHDSRVETRKGVALPIPQSIHVETDFAFGGFNHENANRHVVHWTADPEYTTQVNYAKQTPCLMVVKPTNGPAQTIEPGKTFTSCRAFELLYDSSNRERRSLSLRKMYRTIAPWVTENPLMHHMRVAKPELVRKAIDDAAAVGFEMVILSFGSGFNIENDSPKYIETWREIAEYAKSKDVEIGGYSLLSSRKIGNGNDIVSPKGQKPAHGNCPALTSDWGQSYYKKLTNFYQSTRFTLLEHDGPYPGDVDVTARPPLQKGEQDSRWVQGQIANKFYQWCRERGVYINAPDYYFLNGTNKCGMGYREVNWSLPREMQLLHTRQNIFDGTWYKTPSMGWMFVPLSEYHGGGAAATIEPLDEHLDHYQSMIESNLGLGVQACYRGPRLFDTDRTRNMLKGKVDWFKKYRDILESDVIHGRRPDGRDLDWMLHVNPTLKQKGMLLVYNPTDKPIVKTISVNLYYTGLTEVANVKPQGETGSAMKLNRDYTIKVEVSVEPQGMSWFLIE